MGFIGGNHVRGLTLLLVLACSAGALGACAYTDDEAAAPPAPSWPAPPPLPTVDSALAKEQARNQTQLDKILGPRPSNLVIGASGGLSGDGHGTSLPAVPSGRYKVTAGCAGVTEAALLIAQPGQKDRTNHELALRCGTASIMTVDLRAGELLTHLVPTTTEPGDAAVAGFWIVPAP